MSNTPSQRGEVDREPHIGAIMDKLDVSVTPGMRVLIIDPQHGRMAKWFAVRQASVTVVCSSEARAESVKSNIGEGINVFRMAPAAYLQGCPPQAYDLIACVDWPAHPAKLELLAQSRKAVKWDGAVIVVCPATSESGRLSIAANWTQQHEYDAGTLFRQLLFSWRKQPGWMLSSYPRCGTHMLITALDNHPELQCLGEVFNPQHPAGTHGLGNAQQVLEASWPQPSHGLAMHCYIGRKGGVAGMQPSQKLFQRAWEHIPKDIRAVCVRRRNLLARHVSHLKASQTKRWFGLHATPNKKEVRVDAAKLLKDIEFVKQCWKQQEAHFRSPHIVYYEDLVTKWQDTCAAIQSYLGVTPVEVSPGTSKLGRPLREDIANFGHLRQELGGKVPDEWFKE